MNVKIIRNDGSYGRIFSATSRADARQHTLELLATDPKAVFVEYGHKVYTGSQVYGQWPIKSNRQLEAAT